MQNCFRIPLKHVHTRLSRKLSNTKSYYLLTHAQCGNFENLLSRIFGKNFVKVTVLLKKLFDLMLGRGYVHGIVVSANDRTTT